jgi:hypothetical protein
MASIIDADTVDVAFRRRCYFVVVMMQLVHLLPAWVTDASLCHQFEYGIDPFFACACRDCHCFVRITLGSDCVDRSYCSLPIFLTRLGNSFTFCRDRLKRQRMRSTVCDPRFGQLTHSTGLLLESFFVV